MRYSAREMCALRILSRIQRTDESSASVDRITAHAVRSCNICVWRANRQVQPAK